MHRPLRLPGTLALLLVAMSGCDDDDEGCPSGTVRAQDGTCVARIAPPEDTGDGDTAAPTPSITSLTLDCPDDLHARFHLLSEGLGFGARIFAMDTWHATPWSENHVLPSLDAAPGGEWQRFERVLVDGVPPLLQEPNESTHFACEDQLGPELRQMTFVVRLYDTDARLADCVAFGHDPEGLIAGQYSRKVIDRPPRPGELRSCEVLDVEDPRLVLP